MRQTLFYIPHELAGVPVLGAGWLLMAWAVASVAIVAWSYRRHGWSRETTGHLPILLVLGAAIYLLLPRLEVEQLGLPIRGYGTMLLAGLVAGVGLAAYRAWRLGMDPDVIFSLAMWMLVAGIAGARLFFVIQYWPSFQRPTLIATLGEILRFTEGGLVVYGSLVGALAAFALFCRRRGLSVLAMGDLIGPSMLIGLALGRLGCLMNGCCFGGVCEHGPFSITFPRYASVRQDTLSPPYQHQLTHGELHGLRIGEGPEGPVILHVYPGSLAERAGAPVGATITQMNGNDVKTLDDVRRILGEHSKRLDIKTAGGPARFWVINEWPARSLPVHPTQIYSAINAFLLFLMLWFMYPFRVRNGQIFALTLGLYSCTRFLLEIIRNDEVGWWGTSLTISQQVSLATLVFVVILWFQIRRGPRLDAA